MRRYPSNPRWTALPQLSSVSVFISLHQNQRRLTEVEVLSNNRSYHSAGNPSAPHPPSLRKWQKKKGRTSRPREVQRETILSRAEVVKLEDEILGDCVAHSLSQSRHRKRVAKREGEKGRTMFSVPPDYPSYSDVSFTPFVSITANISYHFFPRSSLTTTRSAYSPTSINTDNSRNPKVPLQLRTREGSEESSTGAINMDGDGSASFGFVGVEEIGHVGDVLVGACEGEGG